MSRTLDRFLILALWLLSAIVVLSLASLLHHLWMVGVFNRPTFADGAYHDTYYVVHHFELFRFPTVGIYAPVLIAVAVLLLRHRLRRSGP